ncbi:MAG: DUF2490 domain-containing protein [Saprospiraceae bacterium]|nr:DUF2490 domain-containing protein [Saprospiraceae bacterium]
MRLFKPFLPVLLLCSALPLHAQDSDLGNWFAYFGSYRVADRWSIWLEGQHRNFNAVGDLEQAFIRTAALYDLPKANSQLGASCGFFPHGHLQSRYRRQSYANEHRFYQQFLTRQRFGRVYLSHRSGWRSSSCLLATGRGSAIFFPSTSASTSPK